MSFLFGGFGKKSPSDLVKILSEQVDVLLLSGDAKDEKTKKAEEKISATLVQMKNLFYGEGEADPKKEEQDKLCQVLLESPALLQMVQHMKRFEFEARKDVAQIWTFVLRQRAQESVEYVLAHDELLRLLVRGYEEPEIALNCGSILRECIRHQQLCDKILNTPELFEPFFEYVQLSTFDVASDAFLTFKLILTKHKALAAKFLETHFDSMFSKYNMLLDSRNYVTKRQSLKLLGELLLDRTNFKVMMAYINSADNLKIMMNLLRNNTKAVQFEAFHVFKIFGANPKKSRPVVEILLRNRDKLIEFLKAFQTDKEDEQFAEEKRIVITVLQKLDPAALGPDPAAAGGASSAAASAASAAPASSAASAAAPK